MNPGGRAWLVSAGFGLAIGWVSGGFLHASLEWLSGLSIPPEPLVGADGRRSPPIGPAMLARDLPFLTLAAQFCIATGATLLLRRSRNMMRRAGAGLLALGVAILAAAIVPIVQAGAFGVLLHPDRMDDGVGAAAVFFLLLTIPYCLFALFLGICGIVLLRKGAGAGSTFDVGRRLK